MARKQPTHPPAAPPGGAGPAPDKLAQVVSFLESLQERQEQMALDLSQLKEGITSLATEVGNAVQALKDEQAQQADVDQLADQVVQLQDDLAAVLNQPPLPPGPTPPGPTPPPTPPENAPNPSPANAPTSSAATDAQKLIDNARQRRQQAATRVGS